jgi:predicted nucleic acid-binding protein
MGKQSLRIYVDTSVFGGVFDREFTEASDTFWKQTQAGYFRPVISGLVLDEINKAPERVRTFFQQILGTLQTVEATEESLQLRQAYLKAGIVSLKYADDALHVATATVSGCSVIVSWNFKHIVHFQKIPLYNAVNMMNGYGTLTIVSPLEVIKYED